MKVLYGTTNQAKLDSMRRITKPLGLDMISLRDIDQPLPVINENGKNPLENARIKASAYYKAFSMPVFSCDSGLYFDGLDEKLQPGTHTRRVNGKELSDEEMIAYYAGLADRYNGQLIGRYRNAICFFLDEETCFSSMDESLSTEPFILVNKPHEKRVSGFPLDSLSMDINSGKYYFDLQERSVESAMEQGFQSFWENVISVIKNDL